MSQYFGIIPSTFEEFVLNSIFRAMSIVGLLVCALCVVGCVSRPAPSYIPSIDNVEILKKANLQAVNVGIISVKADTPGGKSLGIRASTMISPVGSNFGDYVASSLRQDLEFAKLFDAKSGTEISGELLRNNIDAGGVSTASGQMEARFFVKRNGQVRFDKVKQAEHSWESSFAGAIAIPSARNAYPELVKKLIAALMSDAEFLKALRQ